MFALDDIFFPALMSLWWDLCGEVYGTSSLSFLALLDYVGWARPSVCGIKYLLLYGILSNFSCFPRTICADVFFFFFFFLGGGKKELKKHAFPNFSRFLFRFRGTLWEQNFKILPEIKFNSFQTFLNLLSQLSSQKYCSGFLKFDFPTFSAFLKFTIVPHG